MERNFCRIFANVFYKIERMYLNILFLIIGIALVLWGADRFTDGASAVARKWHVSELVIGLTIVSMGTSLPEFIVSLLSTLRGSSDMSVGNILGSNIFNTLVIVGASALMMQMSVGKSLLRRDIPLCIGISVLFYLLCFDSQIAQWEGAILCVLFCAYLAYTFYISKRENPQEPAENAHPEDKPAWQIVGLLVIGIGCLVGGGQLLVNNAVELARMWGVSESVIGLTILAGGTSLPELATSVVAARKGSEGLALGNVVGSNIFNIALVIGICSTIRPMTLEQISVLDWCVFLGSGVLLWITAATGKKLSKREGLVLLLGYGAYLFKLLS